MSFVEVIVSCHVVVFSENVIEASELPGPANAPTAPTLSITARTPAKKSFRMTFLPGSPERSL